MMNIVAVVSGILVIQRLGSSVFAFEGPCSMYACFGFCTWSGIAKVIDGTFSTSQALCYPIRHDVVTYLNVCMTRELRAH